MRIQTICLAIAVALAGCAATQQPPQGPSTEDPGKPAPGHKTLTQAQCEAQGGQVVGDIGNGATQRPDYLCPSGKPPLGVIVPAPGEPIATEGSVCCPR
jgi:hypothetical protein